MTISSPFGYAMAEGFRAARPGRGFSSNRRAAVSTRGFPDATFPRARVFSSTRPARAAGNNTAAQAPGSPGAPSLGTNPAVLAILPC